MFFTGMKKLAQNSLEFSSLYNTCENKVHSILAFFWVLEDTNQIEIHPVYNIHQSKIHQNTAFLGIVNTWAKEGNLQKEPTVYQFGLLYKLYNVFLAQRELSIFPYPKN